MRDETSLYLEEEPSCIACVEPSVVSAVVEVRNQAMPDNLGELDDDVFGFVPQASLEQQAFECNEGVTAPAPHVSCREVRESCSHRVFVPLELC